MRVDQDTFYICTKFSNNKKELTKTNYLELSDLLRVKTFWNKVTFADFLEALSSYSPRFNTEEEN